VGSLIPEDAPPLAVLCALVPLLAARDPGRFTERTRSVTARSRRLIRRMAAALALVRPEAEREAAVAAALEAPTVASAIAEALGARGGEAGVAAIDQALVIGADHELNASTFAARVAASTGADVYAGVAAALACLSGPRHGGASDRVEALVTEIGEPDEAERVVHARQRRGEAIDGFRHPLYPDGDPRGAVLVELAQGLAPDEPDVRTFVALSDAMEAAGAGGPNIDAGLVALALALGLPPGSAVGLFAIARSAGWVAHMLEQYEAGYLVRPRARYRPAIDPSAPIGDTRS
jgi:citrate synthase